MEYHLIGCEEILTNPTEGDNNEETLIQVREEMLDVFLGIRDVKEEIEVLKLRLAQLTQIKP